MLSLNTRQIRRTRGFTLIELLVVISIIALLLSIIMPALNMARDTARGVTCSNHMRTLVVATMMYADQQNNKLMPMINRKEVSQARSENRLTRAWFSSGSTQLPVEEGDGRAFYNLGVLWSQQILDEGKVFFCTTPHIDEIYTYKYHANPSFPTAIRPTPSSSFGVRVSYAYNPESVSRTDRTMRYTKSTELSWNVVLLTDNISKDGPPHRGGWNVAKGDGSVNYFRSEEINKLIQVNLIDRGISIEDGGPRPFTVWDEIIREMKTK